MAQSDRFYFWRGYYDALKMLPTDAQRGAFVMSMCAYAFDGAEPDFGDDVTLNVVWQIVRDQVAESVAIGRDMAERGRRSGASRRRKSGSDGKPPESAEHCSNTVPNTVPNEGKGTDRKGSDTSPSGKVGFARYADARSLASCDEPPAQRADGGPTRGDDAPYYTPEQIASVMAALDAMASEETPEG